MASNPLFIIQDVFCIFPMNFAMATHRELKLDFKFEGNGKIPLGRQGKKFAQLAVF